MNEDINQHFIVLLAPWSKSILAFLFFFFLAPFIVKKLLPYILQLLEHFFNHVTYSVIARNLSEEEKQDILEIHEQLFKKIANDLRTPLNGLLGLAAFVWFCNFSPPIFNLPHFPLPKNITSMNLIILRGIMRTVIYFNITLFLYNLCSAIKDSKGRDLSLITYCFDKIGLKSKTLVRPISALLRGIVIIIGVAKFGDAWNYDITPILQSISFGTLALSIAAKDSLANILGTLLILVDRPFVRGNWIKIENTEGIVEEIQIRSTIVRTLMGDKVYVPNSVMTNQPITNFTDRRERRIEFIITLTYDMKTEVLEKVVTAIEDILSADTSLVPNDGNVRKKNVHLEQFNDLGIILRIVCYHKLSKLGLSMAEEYPLFLDHQEKLLLKIKRTLDELNVEYANTSDGTITLKQYQEQSSKKQS